MCSRTLLTALTLLPAASCIAFGGPKPTDVSPDKALNGWTPKPTNGPSIAELRRRQDNLFPETCGWIDGDYSSYVTCSIGRTCMLYTASGVGMAGCCDDGDTQACGWAKSCIDYDSYYSSDACDLDCELNTFIRKCSNTAAPYCVTWTYPADDVADYGCAETAFDLLQTVLQSGSDSSDSYSTSMSLPTLTGDAVTGYDGEISSAISEIDSDIASLTDDLLSFTTDSDLFGFTTESYSALFPEPTSEFAGSGSSRRTKKKKSVSVGLIVGVVIGALVLLFVVGALIIFLCMKQKKKRQLANNQQAIAAAQASRPQSQFVPQMQQQQPMPQQPVSGQQQHPMPSMVPQSPQPGLDGYYKPAVTQQLSPQPGYAQTDQKFGQPQANEYPVHSPISNPSTPAPAYAQPYYAAPGTTAPPLMPAQSPVPALYQPAGPAPGTHEVDAISAPQGQYGQGGHVYEIGGGK